MARTLQAKLSELPECEEAPGHFTGGCRALSGHVPSCTPLQQRRGGLALWQCCFGSLPTRVTKTCGRSWAFFSLR
eukprot:1670828-Pyramimonas_sp.AAC.1